jgi:CBS domain-containing protein
MARIADVMTRDVVTLPLDASIQEAGRLMRERDIGDVIVVDGEDLAGILTDRDIVVRAIADGRTDARVGEIASRDIQALSPNDDIDEAVRTMRNRAVRRLPVVEHGRPVGVVSLGDLAMKRDPDSALGEISAAEPDE